MPTQMLEFKPNLHETAGRMARFWDMAEPEDRVPIVIRLPNPGITTDGRWFGKLEAYRLMMEEHFAFRACVLDDYIPHVVPQYGHARIAAVCGSPIRYDAAADTIWSVPVIDASCRADELRLDWGNPWARKLHEDYEYLLEKAQGRYAVAQSEIEGVTDTAAALRGFEGLLYDLHECPEAADTLLGRVTEILVAFGQWNHEHVGARQDLCGGMVFGYNLWMPYGSCATCEDAAVMVSPAYLQAHFRKHITQFTSAFSKTIMEVHDEGFHHIPGLGEVPGVSLMTVRNLFTMPERYRDAIRGLRGKKCFMVGGVKPDEIDRTLDILGIRGIVLAVRADTVAEAERALDIAERATQRIKRGQ
jgi:hypothetical protein